MSAKTYTNEKQKKRGRPASAASRSVSVVAMSRCSSAGSVLGHAYFHAVCADLGSRQHSTHAVPTAGTWETWSTTVEVARDAMAANACAGDTTAKFCEVCKVWLNGPAQYVDHLKGHMHRPRGTYANAGGHLACRTCCLRSFGPPHPALMARAPSGAQLTSDLVGRSRNRARGGHW